MLQVAKHVLKKSKLKIKVKDRNVKENDKQNPPNKFYTENRRISTIGARHRKEVSEINSKEQSVDERLLVINSQYLLRSYLHACINSNFVDKAHHSLIWYKQKFRGMMYDNQKIIDVSLFNIVLKGWAMSGKMHKFEEVFRLMKQSKVSPNMQSYAYYLVCLLKQKEVNESSVKHILETMRKSNLEPNRLLVDSFLDADSKSLLIENLPKVDPSITLTLPEFTTSYECRILQNFDSQPRTAYLPLNESNQFDYDSALKEQIEAEISGGVKVKSVYNNAINSDEESTQYYRSLWKSCEENWRKSFTEAFERNINALKVKFSSHYEMDILPYLRVLDVESYVDLMIEEMRILGRLGNYSPPLFVLHGSIARKVMSLCMTRIYRQLCPEVELLGKEYGKYYTNKNLIAEVNPRKFINKICTEKQLYLSQEMSQMTWPISVLNEVGRFLYDIILSEATVDANILKKNNANQRNVPVFYLIYMYRDTNCIHEVRNNVHFLRLFQLANIDEMVFPTNDLPMLVPPIPWITHNFGGYLYSKCDFIREACPGEMGLLGIKLAAKANLTAIQDSLNVLSFCPWKVNPEILDIALKVFRNNGNTALDIPLHSSAFPPLPKLSDAKSKAEKLTLLKKRSMLKQERKEMFSLWCDCLYKLSIANHYRNKIFWFTQNLDFRGRVYSVPPHFNHLGADLSRSLLLFAKGKPLGPKGLDWLKMHVINLTGLKKRCSAKERLEYANEILPLIFDSADNPLSGKKWWMDSEEPWQTLACCKEITKACRSSNPAEYVCHFPVHQDGSCNGLQHYAALGRDEIGAVSVNLAPSERPNDVYSDVAAEVEKLRQSDTESSVAKTLEGFVNRKVIKQTVMTYVYGVTRYGAKLQITKRLKEDETFPQDHCWTASLYLTHKTFDSIQNMFNATRKIQDWFTNCARTISNVLASPVEWITPLGFPIVQPYFKKSSNAIKKKDGILSLKTDHSRWKPNTLKQKNAFPPNFIHSLDSSHMMLTALHCEKEGITFAAVHDSYWTHPCNIDDMNRICREQFVALHSEPILSDLSKFMVEKYEPLLGKMYDENSEEYTKILDLLKSVPETGSFDLTNVMKSTYFFS